MRSITKSFRHLIVFSAIFALLSAGTPADQDYAGLKIITNKDVGISSLKQAEFKKIIYGKKQHWSNGKIVKIALIKTANPTGTKVAKDIFRMSANAFNKYWFALVFEGKCKPPTSFLSEAELIAHVAMTPGAIAVVSDKAETNSVNTLSIVP